MMNKKRFSIGILIGGVHTYFPKEIIRGIIMAAKELDVDVTFFLGTQSEGFFHNLLGETKNNAYDYQFNTVYDYSLLSGLDGMIINYGTLGIYMADNDIKAFAQKFNSIPTIFLTEVVDAPNCYCYISDNYQGICLIMEHLICEHHYKKILFMSGPDKNTDAAERERAYLDSMKKYGLTVTPSMVEKGDYSEFVNKQVERLLDHNPDAEAIVFSNDEMALCGQKVCQERGLKVGEDIAITGFDNFEMAAAMSPPLTTVSQDGILMGRKAMYDIIDICTGKRQELPSVTLLPVSMIQRESCGCKPKIPILEQESQDLTKKITEMNHTIAAMKQDLISFQRKSWLIPLLVRDLNECENDELKFHIQIMEKIKKLKASAAYVFLLDPPVSYDGTSWSSPETLRLASSYQDGKVVAYYPYDRPLISKEHPVSEIISVDACHQYMAFLLFSSERQYGLLMCDIAMEDFSFFYMISLQIGLSLRYLEISQAEAAHRHQISHSMELMREQNRVLDIISGHDELTGLLNLRGFTKQASQVCLDHSGKRAHMIFGDIDHLKEINDTWGHQEGNYTIQSAGHILKKCLREADILARIGGDEFVCLILSEEKSFGEMFCKRVKLACQELNETSEKPFYVELSIGTYSVLLDENTDIQKMLSCSDRQLYQAKQYRRASVKK